MEYHSRKCKRDNKLAYYFLLLFISFSSSCATFKTKSEEEEEALEEEEVDNEEQLRTKVSERDRRKQSNMFPRSLCRHQGKELWYVVVNIVSRDIYT